MMPDNSRPHEYWAMHLPTGKTVLRTTDRPMLYWQFLEELSNWNRIGGSYWKYWAK